MSKISFDDASPEGRSLALAVLEDLGKNGLAGFRQRLEKTGDDTVRSLVGLEQGAPVSTEAVAKMFEPDELEELQTRFSSTAPQLTQRLAVLVPRLVERLTPLGKLPSERALKFQCS